MRELPSNILRMLYMLFNINIFTKIGMITLMSIFAKIVPIDFLLAIGAVFIIFGVIAGVVVGVMGKNEKNTGGATSV